MREATRYDKPQIKSMMLDFLMESKIDEFKNFGKDEYGDKLLDTIMAGLGVIYIEEGKGLIMGMFTPSVWCDKTLTLHELAWYVKPEFRGSTVGYRLLKTFTVDSNLCFRIWNNDCNGCNGRNNLWCYDCWYVSGCICY